ncbi:TetR/AcrR family transcriptional regulator [Williamsia deligens]|uniref:TetR/AcrR family transcriptional regulator n=1 Tax=Williamsia deligens TaxID=321325 RepID=A0ABW3G6N2_9NOCA|nr:TetR/AcrR family transcriptional regulator [Williamsia deligens]MCP2192861.1 transcriptional regulator, TetR family [Williamsia deligens]
MTSTDDAGARDTTRDRIIGAAAELLAEHGPAAVTTRGVAHAAAVQPPTIYRLFGDKDGLLEAVAEHVMADFVARKAAAVAADDRIDPVVDLRDGWFRQVEFGLAHPALYHLFSDPDRVARSPATREGYRVLAERVRRVAAAGRLRVDESRAADMLSATGNGAIRILLSTPDASAHSTLADDLWDAVAAAILTEAPDDTTDAVTAAVIAFRTVAPHVTGLSDAERLLLTDWLDRIIATGGAADVG